MLLCPKYYKPKKSIHVLNHVTLLFYYWSSFNIAVRQHLPKQYDQKILSWILINKICYNCIAVSLCRSKWAKRRERWKYIYFTDHVSEDGSNLKFLCGHPLLLLLKLYIPTEHFTSLEPQNRSFALLNCTNTRWSTDFEALKLCNVSIFAIKPRG